MVTFSSEQISCFSAEEKETLYVLAKRHNVEVPADLEQEINEIGKCKIKAYIQSRFDKEREEGEYSKLMESQLDTNGGYKPDNVQYY